MSKNSQDFFHADLTLTITAESHPPAAILHPTYFLSNRIYLPFC